MQRHSSLPNESELGDGSELQPRSKDSTQTAEDALEVFADPLIISDEALWATLREQYAFIQCYKNWRLETYFMIHLKKWRFWPTTLLAIFLALFWISQIVSTVVGGEGTAITEYASIVMVVIMVIYAAANHLYAVRNAEVARGWTVPEQAKFVRICELFTAGLCLVASVFFFTNMDGEFECRRHVTTQRGRAYCISLCFTPALRVASGPLVFIRIRYVLAFPVFILHPIWLAVRLSIMRHAPMRENAADNFIFVASLLAFVSAILLTLSQLERTRRQDFVNWLFSQRVANAIDHHKKRIRETIGAVLPADSLQKLMRGESHVDQSRAAGIIVTQIDDYCLWSSGYLPPAAVSMIDTLFSQYDVGAKKFKCDKIQQTDDLYISSSGLRSAAGDAGLADVESNYQNAILFALFQVRLANRIPAILNVPERGVSLGVRIGVHCSTATGTFVGRMKKLLYVVVGPALDCALELARNGEKGEVFTTDALLEICPGRFSLEKTKEFQFADQGSSKVTVGAVKRRLGSVSLGARSPPKPRLENSLINEGTDATSKKSSSRNDSDPIPELSEASLPVASVEPAADDDGRLRARFLAKQALQWKKAQQKSDRKESTSTLSFVAPGAAQSISTTPEARTDTDALGLAHKEDNDPEEALLLLDPIQVAEAQLRLPRTTLYGRLQPIHLRFASVAEEKYWMKQLEHADSRKTKDNAMYVTTLALVFVGVLLENPGDRTPLTIVPLWVALGLATARAALPLGNRPAWWLLKLDQLLQYTIAALTIVGCTTGYSTFFNGHPLILFVFLSIALLLGAAVHYWPVTVLAILSCAVGIQIGINTDRTWRSTDLWLSVLVYAWAAWDREAMRRARFTVSFRLEALQDSLERELLWHRGLLHMLVPAFVVDRVALKKIGGNCLTLYVDDCVLMDIRFPASSDIRSTQSMTEVSMRTHEVEGLIDLLGRRGLLIGLIHLVGDVLRVGGPLIQPEHPDGRELYSSVVQLKRFSFRQKKTEPESIEAAALMFQLMKTCAKMYPRATIILCSESGFASVVGNTQPTFEFVGVCSRILTALINAAPDGFMGVTSKFISLLQSSTLSKPRGVEPPLPGEISGEFQTWRLRGVGYVSVTPFSVLGDSR